MEDIDIYNTYKFLVDDYSFEYAQQQFDLGGWICSAHSFFNESGCFTIHYMESRAELDFYYSKQFSTNRRALYEKPIPIYSIEKGIWDKYGKLWFIPNVFFWCSHKRILKASAEVVKTQIQKNNSFFDIMIAAMTSF